MSWTLLIALALEFGPPAFGVEAAEAAAAVVDSVEVSAFWPQHAGFSVRFGEERSDHRLMAMFVLPGERVPIAAEGGGSYALEASSGGVESAGVHRWTWAAPLQPGLYPIELRDAGAGAAMTLNVFVMVPYERMRGGSLNGYRIGAYPAPRRGYEDEYRRPRGFVEVTPELLDTPVSPHFRLGQFVCKQAAGYPRYLVLRQPLLVKLEELLDAANRSGIEARTFSILSAYRTPFYNAAIGNRTRFSRHAYGDAADVFVDEDGDGRMDDLDRDGRHTAADARLLGAIANDLPSESRLEHLAGGLGTYGPNRSRGAFMHVDVRGFAVEWGS